MQVTHLATRGRLAVLAAVFASASPAILVGCDMAHVPPADADLPMEGGVPRHAGIISMGPVQNASGWQFVGNGYFGFGTVTSLHVEAAMPGCDLTTLTTECIEVSCSTAPPTDSAGSIQVSGLGMPFAMTEQEGLIATAHTTVYRGLTTELPSLGTEITVSTTGGVVPAFTGRVVVPPTADAIDLLSNLTRSAGLTVQWPPYAADTVTRTEVILFTSTRRVICGWNGISPTTQIPPVAAARFALDEFVVVNARLLNMTTVVAGDYTVGIEAGQGAVFSAHVMP